MTPLQTPGRTLSDELVVHLTDGLALRPVAADPAFWRRQDPHELATGRLLSVFSYDVSWEYQERHPDGDELVLVLDGSVDLLLDAGRGEERTHLGTREMLIIPAGSWHRAVVHEPVTMLFITPVPARTEHRDL